jgi:hypothetical protein
MTYEGHFWICDNCGAISIEDGMPVGWSWDGPGCGAAVCTECAKEIGSYKRDLEALSTVGPQDPTP